MTVVKRSSPLNKTGFWPLNWDVITFMKPEWQKPGGHSVADLDNAQSPAALLKALQ